MSDSKIVDPKAPEKVQEAQAAPVVEAVPVADGKPTWIKDAENAPKVEAVKPTTPKLGHIVWVGPHRPPEDLMETWISQNPGWIWTIWKDHTAKEGWLNQKAIDFWAARRTWNGVADVMRYEILARCGGVVVDADSAALRPLVDGPEDFLANEQPFLFYENEAVRPGIVACGVMGGPAKSIFWDRAIEMVRHTNYGTEQNPQAWALVGPGLVTELARRIPTHVKIYPSKWMYPEHFSGATAPGADRIKPYATQKWGSTKGYNVLRKLPCSCPECSVNMLRCPWG